MAGIMSQVPMATVKVPMKKSFTDHRTVMKWLGLYLKSITYTANSLKA